jgi:hypothetical protein
MLESEVGERERPMEESEDMVEQEHQGQATCWMQESRNLTGVGKRYEKEGAKVDVHEERDGELGTISESSKALLDPRRGKTSISSPHRGIKIYKDLLERNKTLSLNNILTTLNNRSRITIPIHSSMMSHSLLGDMSIVVPC